MANVITVDDLGDVVVWDDTNEMILEGKITIQELFSPCNGCDRIVHHTDDDGLCDECKKSE